MSLRSNRLAEEIKREITDIVRTQLKDPRISEFTSIMRVEVSNDLRHAKVFVSVYGSEENQKKTLDGLKRATGFIRSELGKKMRLKYLPELSFYLDSSIEQGIKITQLIKEALDDKGVKN